MKLSNNDTIAIFMGGKIVSTEEYEMPHGSHSTGTINHWRIPKYVPYYDYELAKIGQFKYNSDWNWLISVIQEIESFGYKSCIELLDDKTHRVTFYSNTYGSIGNGGRDENKLQAVYLAVVEFIEWYNIHEKLSKL